MVSTPMPTSNDSKAIRLRADNHGDRLLAAPGVNDNVTCTSGGGAHDHVSLVISRFEGVFRVQLRAKIPTLF